MIQFNRSEQRTQSSGRELNESLFCHAIAPLNDDSFLVARIPQFPPLFPPVHFNGSAHRGPLSKFRPRSIFDERRMRQCP
jgi:hypothetical protein